MPWITCPQCGFTQIPSAECLRCKAALEGPGEKTKKKHPRPVPSLPPPSHTRLRPNFGPLAFALVGLAFLLALFFWRSRSGTSEVTERTALAPTPAAGALDLTGRWQTQVPVRLATRPPRPALKEAFLETDREGNILAAGVTLTDPGRGGAGGGYRVTSDGRRRLEGILPLLSENPLGASLPIEFIPYPPWVPRRDRLWRALEGESRRAEQVRYLVLESVEDDYLVQAGINESGFLSYVFFSKAYASDRGLDALSRVIHPEPGSSLRGFQDLVWDFSGSADFLALQVNATLSGPDGSLAKLTLTR